MSLRVAIECSTRSGSIALGVADELRTATLAEERPHAADLVPALERLLSEAGIDRDGDAFPFEAVFVGNGPGSYTGLRVAIATALGLVRGSGAALRAVPSFDALALAELEEGEPGIVVRDARAGRFYFAHYRRTGKEVHAIAPPCALPFDELLAALPDEGTILGDDSFAAAVADRPDVAARVRTEPQPHAREVFALGVQRLERLGPQEPGEVEPLYLRAFGE